MLSKMALSLNFDGFSAFISSSISFYLRQALRFAIHACLSATLRWHERFATAQPSFHSTRCGSNSVIRDALFIFPVFISHAFP
jgi:hypothetical protein